MDGAMLKVAPPLGKGRPVTTTAARKAQEDRKVREVDDEALGAIVRGMEGVYVRVGVFEHNLANDTTVQIELAEQNMKALITAKMPGPGGFDLTAEMIISMLKQNRVYYGINEEFITRFADAPVYREPVLVAEGLKPANGRDAYIQYNFETDQSKVKIREGADGRIDFKNLNTIQNVVQSQPLAKKIPAEKGIAGKNLMGEIIPAGDGRDIALPVGKNVHLADDGMTIVADMNGQVMLVAEKINVEPVYQGKGNVDMKTGNIDFLGSVDISGNVEDGFFVKAAGNITIRGTVEKADLEAGGDIMVHQGIAGKGVGKIRVGRSLWARFIENTIVEAGSLVVVTDGIVNSKVDAFKSIIVKGKRANIVGGHLRATEEINANSIGSPTSGTETVCEVGYDLKSKLQLDVLLKKKAEMEEELEAIQRELQSLINIKKQRKALPEEKEIEMKEMMERRQALMGGLKELGERAQKLRVLLDNQANDGKISASSKVYPGVRITIRDAKEDIKQDYTAVTFVQENGLIRVIKYEEANTDGLEMPDGDSAH
jgi:uncharacterized protein (DUF342 family)